MENKLCIKLQVCFRRSIQRFYNCKHWGLATAPCPDAETPDLMGPPRAQCWGWGQFCKAAVCTRGRIPWQLTGEPVHARVVYIEPQCRLKPCGTSPRHLEVSLRPSAGLSLACTWARTRASAWLRLAVTDETRYGGSLAYSSVAHRTGWISV